LVKDLNPYLQTSPSRSEEYFDMRDKDIIDILKHVESKRQELLNLMSDAKIKGKKIDNVANLVADILNNLTKCFDYCANDIYDKYINPKIYKTKPKIYFPFYKNQLQNPSNPLNALITYKRVVYNLLLEMAEKSQNNEFIDGTRIPYSIAREVRYLVNNDKHSKIIEIDNNGRLELIATSKIGTIIIPEDQLNQSGWRMEVFPNIEKEIIITKSYRLIENNQEVADFCSNAQWNTQQLLDIIYRKFLGSKIINSRL
jgi:hypothetical protein